MPGDIRRPASLGADVVLAQDPASGQQQWVTPGAALIGGHVGRQLEGAVATGKSVDVHDRCAQWMLSVARPLHAAHLVEQAEGHPGECRCQRGDLVHDLRRGFIVHRIAQCGTQVAGDLPLLLADLGLHHRTHPVDPPFGVGERAVLLQKRCAGQKHVGVLRGLVEEQILNDQQLQRLQRGHNVMGVRV